jgi:peptidoglycan/LPS O-acetylase OafA/YrhL
MISRSATSSIDSLTSLRGFLALWVVFFHFWKDMLALFPGMDFLTPVAKQGHLAVPVFFILSGFVLAYNYAHELSSLGIRSYGRFLLMRLARIYPVHLITLLVVVGMVAVCRAKGWPLTDAGYGAGDFVLNLFLAQTWIPNYQLNWNYPSWSISSEWFAYLCFPVICVTILPRITTRFRAHAFLTLCWIATIGLYVFGNEMPFRPLIQVIPTFLAGTAIFVCLYSVPENAQYLLPLRTHHGPDFLLFSVPVMLLLISGHWTAAVVLTGFLLLVYRLAKQSSDCSKLWNNRVAVYLGEVSYSLYMAHALAQKVCYKLLPSAPFSNATLGIRLGVLGAYVIIITVMVLGTYYLIEKPSRRRLRHLFDRRAESKAPVQQAIVQFPSPGIKIPA